MEALMENVVPQLFLCMLSLCLLSAVAAQEQLEFSPDAQRALETLEKGLAKEKKDYRSAVDKIIAKTLRSLERELQTQTKRGNVEQAQLLKEKIAEIQGYAPRDLFGEPIEPQHAAVTLSVPANGKSEIMKHTGILHVTPNPESVWNTSPTRWEDVNFLGHVGQNANNGMAFMQLCYSLNGAALVAINGPIKIKVDGEIYFGPSDLEGGGGIGNNTGSIELIIIKY